MDRYTRRELKHDEFQDTVEAVQIFISEHLRQIILVVVAASIIIAGALWYRSYSASQEAAANNELQAAIGTFDAYVGSPEQNGMPPSGQVFLTAKAKYEQALKQFGEIVQRYPRTRAAGYAEVHMGICQARLGDTAVALKTLRQASRNSSKQIASLAQFALAGELLVTGKRDDAIKIYESLANHPTLTVPRATALLAMAAAYRTTQPNRARDIYDQIQKEFGSDEVIAQILTQQIATLPKK
ncbi:MAG: tetratricopeptide repeat protein [Acidobacteria bacterium]|nr:tetratricopeptide repeat protein [Acidobacteriota bacterium]